MKEFRVTWDFAENVFQAFQTGAEPVEFVEAENEYNAAESLYFGLSDTDDADRMADVIIMVSENDEEAEAEIFIAKDFE